MIIEPRMRGFICLTAHPDGCAQNVKNQIDYVKSKGKIDGAKKVLVIGASTGFGLASRITSAFGCDAATVGVFFEKEPSEGKTATPGYYNSAAFEMEAEKAGLYAKSINGDAFSNEIKQQTIDIIKKDLVLIDNEIEINDDVNNKAINNAKKLLYYDLRNNLFDFLYNEFHMTFKKWVIY